MVAFLPHLVALVPPKRFAVSINSSYILINFNFLKVEK